MLALIFCIGMAALNGAFTGILLYRFSHVGNPLDLIFAAVAGGVTWTWVWLAKHSRV